LSGDYSLARARTSLLHFGAGKLVSAVTGLAVLLLTIRLAPADAFGAYVTVMAITEIFYLVSGLGLSYFVQRYVPELRIRAPDSQFRRQLWRLLLWRGALALAFALPLCLLFPWWGRWLELPVSLALTLLIGGGVVLGSLMRYFDELLQSLLLQGWVQIQTVLRNCLRLLMLAIAWRGLLMLNLSLLVAIEVLVAAAAVLGACWMQASYLRRPREPSAATSTTEHLMPDAWSQSLRFYAAQVLGQAYSGNAIKLVVNAVAGLQGAAVFGFAYSITGILRTYSPAFLLGGWVRPLMVSRFVQRGHADDLKPITRLVVSLSLVGLLPFLLVFFVFGSEIAALFGKGRYPDGATLLAPMVAVVCLQAVHAVLGMVCAAVERTNYVLMATTVCLVSLPIAYAFTRFAGLPGAVAALLLGEVMWIGTVLALLAHRLRQRGFANLGGLARAAALAAAVGLALWAAHLRWSMHLTYQWLAAATLASLLYWGLAFLSGIFGSAEQTLIRRFLARKAGP